jgi:hypothetical protein
MFQWERRGLEEEERIRTGEFISKKCGNGCAFEG